jgi:hypothetical protein
METKVCKKCGVEKDLCNFNRDKYAIDGYRYRCRECTSSDYKNFYYRNREIEINRQVIYQKNNKDSVNKNRNIRYKINYENDLFYRLKTNLRNRVKLFLKSSNFSLGKNKTFTIVGCSPEELKSHLESQFINHMSWENYGHNGWHIDHKIPLSSAKTNEELISLCHYTNLQPLWCEENYKKGNKILWN